jgi:hypothetical protein
MMTMTMWTRRGGAGLLLVMFVVCSLLLRKDSWNPRPAAKVNIPAPRKTAIMTSPATALATFMTAEASNTTDPPEEEDKEEDLYTTTTFRLQHCDCERTLRVPKNVTDDHRYLTTAADIGPDYWKTTCSRDAARRGPGQRVVAFSFYGSPTTARHKAKQYFAGIVENLELMPNRYPDWVMRLYYDMEATAPLMQELCGLACGSAHLDLCYVQELPGTPMRNASQVFAMNWRFFPTLDPQVPYMYVHVHS